MERFIGSSDVRFLLAGKDTKGHRELMRRFVNGERVHGNAEYSSIYQFRAGAILEKRYHGMLPRGLYCPQYPVIYPDMPVLRCTIDYARLQNHILTDFDEVKTVWKEEYGNIARARAIDNDTAISYIKKCHRNDYNQVQEQLLCTGLGSANLVYIRVYSYHNAINRNRILTPGDIVKIRIYRDQAIIGKIIERARIFQSIKEYYEELA